MEDLNKQVDDLRIMFLFPAEFLTNHFKNLKSKIDSAALNLLTTCYNMKNQAKINESWEQIIQKLKQYEKECLTNSITNLKEDFSNETTDKIKQIELKLALLSIDYNQKAARELEHLIADEMNRLQRFFFLNKTFLFVEKKTSNKTLDLSAYFGKLICITNEYFSKNSTDFIIK